MQIHNYTVTYIYGMNITGKLLTLILIFMMTLWIKNE